MNLVYIASPFAGDVENNIKKARAYCKYTAVCGYVPIAPHLLFPQFLDDNSLQEREKGIEMGLELLKHCEEVWVFGSVVTDGMKKEIDMATKLGMPITYRDWGENQCIFTQTI